MFINLTCPGKLFIFAMKSPFKALQQFPSCHFLWQKQKILSARNLSRIVHSQGRGEIRSPDGFTAPLPSGRLRHCDLRSCLQAEKRKKGRVQADHQGNPVSFFRIQRLCDYRLVTTNASFWLKRSRTDRDKLIVCFLMADSFLCLSLSFVTLK